MALLIAGIAPAVAGDEGKTGLALARQHLAGEPLSPERLPADADEALRIRTHYVHALLAVHGPITGYKAALTHPDLQARFGVDHPIWGVLLEGMLLGDGATIRVDSGTRLMFEGDLIVRVGDASIRDAETDGEILAALDAVIPFIEVPDMPYAEHIELNGATLMLCNVGARWGVRGTAIPLDGGRAGLDQISVRLVDEDNRVLAESRASQLMGHPVQAVRWLRDELAARGIELQPGDLLSLGSMTPLLPAQSGMTVRAVYSGFPGPDEIVVTVSFR